MKLGRPTKYKRKFCQIAYDLLSKGYSKEALAGNLGVSKQCLYEWVQAHKDFGDAVERGVSASQFFWEDLGMRGTQGQIKGFNPTAWMFNMKNRFGWAEKTDTSINQSPPIFVVTSYIKAAEEMKKQMISPASS